jgi:hypothetical protein
VHEDEGVKAPDSKAEGTTGISRFDMIGVRQVDGVKDPMAPASARHSSTVWQRRRNIPRECASLGPD